MLGLKFVFFKSFQKCSKRLVSSPGVTSTGFFRENIFFSRVLAKLVNGTLSLKGVSLSLNLRPNWPFFSFRSKFRTHESYSRLRNKLDDMNKGSKHWFLASDAINLQCP